MSEYPASDDVCASSSYRWFILFLCFLTNFFVIGFLQLSVPALVPEIAGDLEISITQTLTLYSAILFTLIFTRIPGGLIGDRLPVRWVGGLGGLIMAFATVGRWLVPTYEGLLTASVLVGIGSGMVFPNIIKVLTQWFPPAELGLAQGVNLVGFNVGSALVGSISGGIVLRTVGEWERVFLSYGILAMVIGGLWLLFVRAPDSSDRLGSGMEHVPTDDSNESMGELLHNLFTLPDTYLLSGIALVTLYLIMGFLGIIPTWAEQVAFPVAEVFVGTPLYAGAVGALLFPWLSDRVGRRPILYLTVVGNAIAVISCGYSSTLTVFVGAMVLGGMCGGGMYALLFTLPGELSSVGSARTGTMAGTMIAIGQLGGTSGPIVGGYVMETFGIGLSGVVLALPSLIALPLIKQLKL